VAAIKVCMFFLVFKVCMGFCFFKVCMGFRALSQCFMLLTYPETEILSRECVCVGAQTGVGSWPQRMANRAERGRKRSKGTARLLALSAGGVPARECQQAGGGGAAQLWGAVRGTCKKHYRIPTGTEVK
jgi:hypothetical protein